MGDTAMADRLAGSEWAPTEIASVPAHPDVEVYIQFDQDGRFAGKDGCNQMMGRYLTNENAILFGPLATTMMICVGPAADQEKPFKDALNAARQFERDGFKLTLRDAAGTVVMLLQQRDAD
jgi:heat shock protein HslJ